jgi:hypothetical protein
VKNVIINNFHHQISFRSRVSSVTLATRLRAGRLEFDYWQRVGIFLFATAFRPALGPTQPPIQWVPRALSLGVKRQERETDDSSPSSAYVKNAWSYTSTFPIRPSTILPFNLSPNVTHLHLEGMGPLARSAPIGDTCNRHGGNEKCVRNFSGKPVKKISLVGRSHAYGKIGCEGIDWTDLAQETVNGGLLWTRYRNSGYYRRRRISLTLKRPSASQRGLFVS